jgi:phage tail-like protein
MVSLLPGFGNLLGELNTSFRFIVQVSVLPPMGFTEITLPPLEMQTEEVMEGGLNNYSHKLPKRMVPGVLSMKKGVVQGDLLIQWYYLTLRGLHSFAKRDITVIAVNPSMIPVTLWHFSNAYPVKYVGPSFNAATSAALVEQVDFAHEGIFVI